MCLILVFAGLSLSTEAKADAVSLTITPTTYAFGSGWFTVPGFFTNSGNLTFRANRFDVVLPPGNGPMGFGASIENGELIYTRPVPGMSVTPVLRLIDVSFLSPIPQGVYTFTVTFSGFDSSGAAITTAPAQFTVNDVPVPEPTTVLLLTTGLVTLGASIRRRHKSTKKQMVPHAGQNCVLSSTTDS